MHFLLPSDPFNKSLADDAYAEEFEAFRAIGRTCSVFSFEDFESGQFKPRPGIPPGEAVVYRGWMLMPDDYSQLHAAVAKQGGALRTSPAAYRRCHYLPEWYPTCQDLTPETVFLQRDSDFAAELAEKHWPAYFVKDFVKSLTTARGSIASSAKEVEEIVALIEQYRGRVEGGVCVRKYEPLIPETEERYFVLNGHAYARQGEAPALVNEVARRVDCPFFSVDVVAAHDNGLRVIELGDGQVSDRKKWPAARFAAMFSEG